MRPLRPSIARYVSWFAILLFALLASCGGSPVPCDADIVVTKTADTNDGACTGADCSLREAVIRANTCPGTQTIRVPAGTYTLTRAGADEEAASTGDLDLTGNVTIWGTSPAVIDGNAADRIFDVKAGVTASLSGLVIQNGHEYNGSGIRISNATLNLNESTIQNNISTWAADHEVDGGGIYAAGSSILGVYMSEIRGNHAFVGGGIATEEEAGSAPTLTLSHTIVAENEAYGPGGGLWLGPGTQSTIINTEVEENTAGNEGGGIHNNGDLELTSSTVENNSSINAGGGILNGFVTLIARDVMLSHNEGRTGGGIYNLGMAHFYQSSIVYNTSYEDEGGGVFNADVGGLLLDNTTVGANTGGSGGGGIFNDGGNIRLMFVTVAGNNNGGIHNSGGGERTIRNTILAGNSGGNCAGVPVDSIGHNIDDGNTCALAEGSDLPNTDPMLEPLAPVGTWSPAYELMAGSPAIDSADPDRCAGTDQHGVIRPQGAGCDRGAVEHTTSGGDALISGKVWHDLCAVPDHGYPPTPPPGCSDPDGDSHHTDANGILEPGEPGLPGVTLRLKSGTCAAGSDLMTAVTGPDGEYSFPSLAAGTYCVSIDALADGNDLVLIPGGWTYPTRGGGPVMTEIVLGEGEARADVNFGWDFQFLPMMPDVEPTATPTPALISFGKPVVSAETIYFYGPNAKSDCGPKEVKFQIGLSSTKDVANVLFFARLKEQSSGRLGAWTDGVSMTPIGNNQYEVTLWAENIPDVRTFGESWLQYQFVALDKAGQAIVRSEVFWNVTLLHCEYKPR
ncbi:MAG: CSLREA domain-containing protein [Anaerolineales bacterium]|nr:CSLREA domain-containing protein [Anaerolineales bacterium]